jgi:hypothetical protein
VKRNWIVGTVGYEVEGMNKMKFFSEESSPRYSEFLVRLRSGDASGE